MFWLAGLMGLMAVGAVAYVDVGLSDDDDSDVPPDPVQETTDPAGDILSGTANADEIIGTGGDDQIGGYDGDDLLFGQDGNDDAHGAGGNDTLSGENGRDSINGDDGDDDLYGGEGDDSLMGHNDDDILYGDAGDDTLLGAAGDDILFGGSGDDALHGGLDDDLLHGGTGTDTLFGGWGDDTITGIEPAAPAENATDDQPAGTPQPPVSDDTDADFLNGGGGDDLIIPGQNDVVTAGDGSDRIVMGDWISQGNAVHLMDYTSADDSLLFVWDDSAADSTEPDISVLPPPEEGGDFHVLMGETLIARISSDGALDASDISLIPLSAAFSTGLVAL